MKARIEEFNPVLDMPGYANIWLWEWNQEKLYHDAESKDIRMTGLPWKIEK